MKIRGKTLSSENSGSQWNAPGMRPTLNGTGFMFEVLDEFANGFIEYSRTIEAPVLDIGCAFGVASRPALEGGARVVACDMEQRHLDILRAEINPEHLDRLECVQGSLPSVDFEPGRFGAILCSRVLHFLDGSAIDASIRKMASWLQPGGRLYLLADTPYGFWRRFIPVFEAKTARGDRWPGLLLSPENYLPFKQKGQSMNMPP
ncbi:MAG TPA: class I SAM-dependent methyltransferase, partial [Chromatiales bacterium]|nr:class I SAM-dependent methyltransferase [Chromatiales bacterium]